MGYFGEILFSVMVEQAYMIVAGTVLLLFISICFYHQAFYKIFEHVINDELNQCKTVGRAEEIIRDLIQFRSEIQK